MPRLRLQLLAAAIFALAWTQSAALEPQHESGILNVSPPTPYIHYYGGNPPAGRVLVVHGLDVSKEIMGLFSSALADAGFEVYAIDLPGHGDSRTTFQTEAAAEAIRSVNTLLGEKTIVVGHSLGAGLLLDLAATEHFSTMILLSPPPLSIDQIHATRVFIATGDMDVPRIRSFLPIAADIGTPNVESHLLPWSGHSGALFNPRYVRQIVDWLGADGNQTKTWSRLGWFAVMLFSSVALGISLLSGGDVQRVDTSITSTTVRFVIACASALFILRLANPMAWLRLFATDYLIGFVLITGLLLTVAALYEPRGAGISSGCALSRLRFASSGCALPRLRFASLGCPYRLHHAIFAAAFVIVVPGLLVVSRVLHMSLSDGRWWRFPCIALAGLPFFFSDELTIRTLRGRWQSTVVALLTRGLLLAFILTGVLTLNRANAFLVLIVPLIVVFWIGLWFATGAVHRHTQSAFAAAVFAALVQGWAFAAWFVTI